MFTNTDFHSEVAPTRTLLQPRAVGVLSLPNALSIAPPHGFGQYLAMYRRFSSRANIDVDIYEAAIRQNEQ